MEQEALAFIALVVPIIAGLVEAVKRAGMPVRFAALASVFFGLVLGGSFGASSVELTFFDGIVTGLVSGLSASGLYSTLRAAVK